MNLDKRSNSVKRAGIVVLSLLSIVSACRRADAQASSAGKKLVLTDGWYIQPSPDVTEKALKATVKVYNLDMSAKYSRETTLDIPADGVQKILTLPAIDGLTSTYFLNLSLRDSDGKLVSSNFYWLSIKPDVLDWDKSTWYTTPTKSFDDLTALNTLPQVKVNVTSESEIDAENGTTRVTVENPTQNPAFAVHLKVMKPSRFKDPESENNELEVLPVIWQDNYFPLMPGEKREITATYKTADLQLESTSSDTPDLGSPARQAVGRRGWVERCFCFDGPAVGWIFFAHFAQLRLFDAAKGAQMLPAFVGCPWAGGYR